MGKRDREREGRGEERKEGGVKTTNSRRQIHSAYTRKKVTKKSTPSCKTERRDTAGRQGKKSLCLY